MQDDTVMVDKASADYLIRISEPYLSTLTTDSINTFSTVIADGFNIKDYPYFYYNSTSKDRKLYTKAGNTILQNMVCLTEYLSNEIGDLDIGEVITIHYGD